ncbi:MAG: glycosyltransferase family 39 protein, partial [Lentisphaerae bacterium]|nr:glycosyltransferase family 39 protein [Lentisphaerota bacterium]
TLSTGEAWLDHTHVRPDRVLLSPLMICAAKLVFTHWVSACVFVSSLFYVLTAVAVFLLARRLYDEKTAVVASVLYIFGTYPLLLSLYGGTDPPFAFLLVMTYFTLLKSSRWYHYAFAGMLFGLAGLTRPVGPFYAVPLLAYVWLQEPKRGWMRFSIVLVVVAVMAKIPYFFNAYILGQQALYSLPVSAPQTAPLLCHSGVYPGYTASKILEFPPDPLRLIFFDPLVRRLFIEKVVANFQGIKGSFIHDLTGSTILTLLGIAGLFVPLKNRRFFILKWMLVLCLGAQIGVTVVFLYTPRYFYPMMPFVLISASAAILWGAGKIGRFLPSVKNRILVVAVVLLLLLPIGVGHRILSVPCLTKKLREERSVVPYKKWGEWFSARFPENVTLLADGPWLPDVYGENDSRCIIITPLTLHMLDRLHYEKFDCDLLLLTSAYTLGAYPEWAFLYNHPQPFLGYEMSKFKTNGITSVVYWRDRSEYEKTAEDFQRKALTEKENIIGKLQVFAEHCRVSPRNEGFRNNLTELRSYAAQIARPFLQDAEQAVQDNRGQDAFLAFQRAAAYMDVVSEPRTEELVHALTHTMALQKVRYTNNNQFNVRTTLSGFPYDNTLTDGVVMGKDNGYFGGDADILFDLGWPQFMDHVELYAYLDPEENSLRRISVFSSIDGWTWQLVKSLSFSLTEKGAYSLSLRDLNVFTRHVRVFVEGDEILPVEIGEIELWGYAQSDLLQVTPDWEGFRWRMEGELFHHHTGGRCDDPLAQNGQALIVNKHKNPPGFMFFGRYMQLPAGYYTAIYRMRVMDAEEHRPAYILDIAADHGRVILSKRPVMRREINLMDQYEDSEINFYLDNDTVVECRIHVNQSATVACDYVTLIGRPVYVFINYDQGQIQKVTFNNFREIMD